MVVRHSAPRRGLPGGRGIEPSRFARVRAQLCRPCRRGIESSRSYVTTWCSRGCRIRTPSKCPKLRAVQRGYPKSTQSDIAAGQACLRHSRRLSDPMKILGERDRLWPRYSILTRPGETSPWGHHWRVPIGLPTLALDPLPRRLLHPPSGARAFRVRARCLPSQWA